MPATNSIKEVVLEEEVLCHLISAIDAPVRKREHYPPSWSGGVKEWQTGTLWTVLPQDGGLKPPAKNFFL